MEACLYPTQMVHRLIKDPWLVLRVLLSIGVGIAFAFWDRSNLDQVKISESMVESDVLVDALSPLHELFAANPTRVPVVSAHILVFIYLFVISQFGIYIHTGDFIFPSVLLSWACALGLTRLTTLPLSSTAIRYNQGTWFFLERFVTDTTVSWHLMMLLLAVYSVCRAYPYLPTYALSAAVITMTCIYLLATRNAYTLSLIIAVFCAGVGIAGQMYLTARYTKYVERRNYERMGDVPEDVEMPQNEIRLAEELANHFTEDQDHEVEEEEEIKLEQNDMDTTTMDMPSGRLQFAQSHGEIELDEEDDDNDDGEQRRADEDPALKLP